MDICNKCEYATDLSVLGFVYEYGKILCGNKESEDYYNELSGKNHCCPYFIGMD